MQPGVERVGQGARAYGRHSARDNQAAEQLVHSGPARAPALPQTARRGAVRQAPAQESAGRGGLREREQRLLLRRHGGHH